MSPLSARGFAPLAVRLWAGRAQADLKLTECACVMCHESRAVHLCRRRRVTETVVTTPSSNSRRCATVARLAVDGLAV